MIGTEQRFRRLVAAYLQDLQIAYETAINTGEATPELSFRPVLDRFFRGLPDALGIGDVGIIFEPRRQAKAGHPDWRFHDWRSMSLFGYVEAKPFDPRSEIDPYQFLPQIRRYLELGSKVMLTDGIDFVIFRPRVGKKWSLASLVRKPLTPGTSWQDLPIDFALLPLLRDFFRSRVPRFISDSELMADIAKRARAIREDVLELVRLETGSGMDELENQAIEALHGLRELLETGHDPDLCDDHKFADMVAQVLVFGLLYAHRHLAPTCRDPRELSDKLHGFWTEPIRSDGVNRLRPFRALAGCMASGSLHLGALRTWYSDCVLCLSHVRLSRNQAQSPNYHDLYEQFLASYDPVSRIDFGGYATRAPLPGYMVAFCDWVAKSKFGRSSLYMHGNKIIDPCCGTGNFLEEVLRAISSRDGESTGFPTMAGFEILAAPYALAQYRLTFLDWEGIKGANSVRIVLCNTLSDFVVGAIEPPLPSVGPQLAQALFNEERQEAVKLATPPITAVIGNPPSSDAGLHIDPATHGMILKLVEDFRPPRDRRTSRQNVQKQMQNDFVKFLRWACHKLPEREPGILAFVLPSSFLKHVSHAYARRWLLDRFSWIWVLEFDRDIRTGAKSSNFFPTRQGRAVVFCARPDVTDTRAEVRYQSILDKDRSAKAQFFSDETETLRTTVDGTADRDFRLIEVSLDEWRFQPSVPYDEELYEKCWQLCHRSGAAPESEKAIFLRHCSGLKLGITSALVHADERILLRRTREIGNSTLSYERLYADWFKGQRRPPNESSLSPAVREEMGTQCSRQRRGSEHVRPYSFRPFCRLYAFLPIPVLQKLAQTGGGGTRYRPEVLAAYSQAGNFGISVAPAPEDIGESLHRFSSFAWHIPDNDLCTRGNAHVFCPYFPEYKKTGTAWDNRPKLNVSRAILEALGSRSENAGTTAKEIVFYVYAVLCSNVYLDRFEGALYRTAGEWPRVPLPAERESFERLADLGRQLAEGENPDIETSSDQDMVDCLSLLRGKQIRIKRCVVDENAATVTLQSTEGEEYVASGFDRDILSYKVAGYSVVEEWLKWHSDPYLRRTFTWNDAQMLAGLISRLRRQFKVIESIDEEMRRILSKSSNLL